uniref:Uncharacterized protein n=1 Tax=Esox lucius TaxID=8010 RepID=A0AAY5L4D1_ESOLU
MGNLISRPSCLGQKSKQVRSDEAYLKECFQQRREWHHGEAKREDHTPPSDKPLRMPYVRPPLVQPGSIPGSSERRASFQRRDSRDGSLHRRESREGSPWSWKTLASREVTEVTEVTETVVTEIVEVTEYPSGEKGGDPVVTRTVRVLTGAAEELAEVIITLFHAASCSLLPQGMRSTLTLRDDFADSETFHQSLESLLTWVCEVEELTANQKPASSEVKVVKAQLQEQKVSCRHIFFSSSPIPLLHLSAQYHTTTKAVSQHRAAVKKRLPLKTLHSNKKETC